MGDGPDNTKDAAVDDGASEEWDKASTGPNDATVASSDLLVEAKKSGLLQAMDDDLAADEFDDAPATVMDDSLRESILAQAEMDASSSSEPAVSGSDSAGSDSAGSEDEASPQPSEVKEVSGSQVLEEVVDDFDEQQVTMMEPKAAAIATDNDEAIGKSPCPSCGVMVAPGYPSCPRCKKALPSEKSARKKQSGGTSVVGRTVPWAIVVVLAILTGIIYYLAERETDTSHSDSTEESNSSDEPSEPIAPESSSEPE